MSILLIITLVLFTVAIFEYITKQNINAVIIVILAILVFHSIYLEVIDKQVEEILEKLKEEGLVRDDEEND
jgi:glucan phosphoethanolaminetransferase (alkaline phosphatase superfamily)